MEIRPVFRVWFESVKLPLAFQKAREKSTVEKMALELRRKCDFHMGRPNFLIESHVTGKDQIRCRRMENFSGLNDEKSKRLIHRRNLNFKVRSAGIMGIRAQLEKGLDDILIPEAPVFIPVGPKRLID
jgi:hypothetical protein